MSADAIADVDAVRELVEQYARAVDARDSDALIALFAPDAVLTLADELALSVLPTELTGSQVARVLDGVGGFDRTRHVVDEHRATIDGPIAYAETICAAHHVTGDRDLVLTVGYRDTFGKQDGRWRFTRRELRLDAYRPASVAALPRVLSMPPRCRSPAAWIRPPRRLSRPEPIHSRSRWTSPTGTA